MIDLTSVTLASIVYNDNPELLARTEKVLRYCTRYAAWFDVVLFTCVPPQSGPTVVQIPVLTHDSFQTFIAKCAGAHIKSSHLLWVHEDGFPVNWSLWEQGFLDYDFIGAPWHDKVVGNDGFSLMSKALMGVMTHAMSWHDGKRHSDEWLCRDNRMEMFGLKRASFEVAKHFSKEYGFDDQPAFGFHNRTLSPSLYEQGWKQIEETLKL